MRALTVLIFLLILCQITYAQPPEVLWTRDYGGNFNEQGLGIIEPAEGGLCFIGNEGSFDGGGTDGWIVMMDEEGEEIWSANFGGAGYDRFADVEQVEDGWIVAGYNGSQGNVMFEFWLAKLDNDGNMLWQRFYGGGNHERGSSVLHTPDGGFLITGSTFSFGGGESDGWVVKTDDEGWLEWSHAYGGGTADAIDNAIAIGEDEYMLFGYTSSDGAGGYDHWMIHVNAEGEVIDEWTFGGEHNDMCYGQILNEENQFILAGITDPDGNEQYDVIMRCISMEGEELWSRVYEGEGSERCFSVVETVNGGYLLAGATGPYNIDNADNLVIRTDAEGEVLWSLTYGENRSDVTRGVVQTSDGGFAIIGWTYSFGNGEGQAWLAKIDTELTGVLDGMVFDRVGNRPLEGAFIETTFGQSAQSDEEGYWIIDRAYAGEFEVTASLPGFNNQTLEDLALEAEDTLSVVFRLNHPEFTPSEDEFEQVLAIGDVAELDLSVHNTGNGPLNWTVSTGLRGDANADPWSLRRSHYVGADVDDSYIYGVVFIDNRYYVSGANDENPQIYVFGENGELIESFDQPGEDRRGFKDLAFDGELLWGAIRNVVYGITLDGEVVTQFESPNNPTTVLTWDSDRECLWIGSTTRNPLAYTREGEPFEELEVNRRDLRLYGLAYFPDDPDDSPLYVYHKERETNRHTVHKINIEEDETTFVAYLNPEVGGSPAGAFITNQVDYLTWVLVTIVSGSANQGGDRIDLYQISANTAWLNIDPQEGVLDADQVQEYEIVLDATELIPIVYPGELTFTHNAEGGETRIPVTLTIGDGPREAEQDIALNRGWSLISAYLQPENDDVRVIVRNLVDNGTFIMMKNGSGQFFVLQHNFNNIPGWDVSEGYWIKMLEPDELTLSGMTVEWDEPIPLAQGWQIISYYPQEPINAEAAMSGLGERLLIVKDGSGRFYVPAFGFSNIGDMQPGSGYQIKMSEDAELIYQREGERVATSSPLPQIPELLPTIQPTASNMSLLVLAPAELDGEIGVYEDEKLVGSGVLRNGKAGIAIWEDDPSTPETDGAFPDRELDLILTTESGSQQAEYLTLEGSNKYSTDALWVVNMRGVNFPEGFDIIDVYPNPFNSLLTVTFALSGKSHVGIILHDILGREVAAKSISTTKPGVHSISIEAEKLTSGIYVLSVGDGVKVLNRKVCLVR